MGLGLGFGLGSVWPGESKTCLRGGSEATPEAVSGARRQRRGAGGEGRYRG